MTLADDLRPLPAVGGRIEVARDMYADDGHAARLDLGYSIFNEVTLAGSLQVIDVLAPDVLHHEESRIGVAGRCTEATLARTGSFGRDAERVDQPS